MDRFDKMTTIKWLSKPALNLQSVRLQFILVSLGNFTRLCINTKLSTPLIQCRTLDISNFLPSRRMTEFPLTDHQVFERFL